MSAENISGTYDKANSILELRSDRAREEHAVARLQALLNGLPEEGDQSKRQEIIRVACMDALGLSESPKFWLRPHVVEEIDRLHDGELERYLYYRYRYDVYPAEKMVDEYPPCIQIEPTSICNFRCVFCYQVDDSLTRKSHGHMGMMDLNLFKSIIDQIEGKVEAVTLASRGEPLVNPAFPDMLAYLSGKFLAVKVNTNASLLTEEVCHAILKADIQTLVFSADAAAEPMYSQLRVNGKLDRVLKNIERFNEIKAEHYPDSRLITRVSGVKYSDMQNIDEMESFWSRLVDQVMFVDYNPWENVYQAAETGVEKPCSDLWRRMFVWWDGRTNPCDVDYLSTMSVGNIQTSSVSSLWLSEQYQKLRADHLSGKRIQHEPCKRCVVV